MQRNAQSLAIFDSKHRRARLLIVDDLAISIVQLRQIFDNDYDVFMAMNAESALAFCLKNPPDLILMDVVMPSMSGLELCEQLKLDDRTTNIPVIFVTGTNRVEDEAACWHAGCVDFISKPVNAPMLLNRVRSHLQLKFQVDFLHELALIDGLTGVANRRYFDTRLVTEWRRCARNAKPLSLILIDVDFFQRYSEKYGRQAGDSCMRKITAALNLNLHRPSDLVARYHGEQFVCLLPETTLEGANVAAGAIDGTIRSLAIEHTGVGVDHIVTVSMGIASVLPDHDESISALIAAANEKLQLAKTKGCGLVAA